MANNIIELELINKNKWSEVLKQTQPIFKSFQDGKNLFHYACIRGKKSVIRHFLKLKSSDIFFSDFDGNTGAHFLALSGYDEILLNIAKYEPKFLKIKNNNDQFVFNMLINRPKTLLNLIKIMEKKSMLDYLDYIRYDGKTLLIDLINIVGKSNNTEYYEIFKKIKRYDIPKTHLPLNYTIAKGYTKLAKFFIENINIDFNFYDEMLFTPLILAILNKNIEIARLILKQPNININYGGVENKYVPLILIIKLELFELYDELSMCKNINYNVTDNLLNSPVYHLIQYLKKHTFDPKNSFFREILLKSDLNQQNANGDIFLHLLFETDFVIFILIKNQN